MDKRRLIAIFTTASLPWMTGTAVHIPILFYPGKFSLDKRSILAVGDISQVIPDEKADIAILEEPEHLTWYHHGKRWKIKFAAGYRNCPHTNYLAYVRREKNGRMQAYLLKYLIIGCWYILSQGKQIICCHPGAFSKGAYYIGKMVWSKGYKELLNLLRDHQKELAGLESPSWRDHANFEFHDYKVFLNPSTTDVVCTTTAEALAMGKIVVCANHPSNEFFKQFPNCRTYENSDGFVKVTQQALAEQPAQLTDAQRHELSWEAATERFLRAAELEQS
ncbi:hypothetical protein M0R45_034503 [Rubus argutus]|uniref:Digalactosyldiacylglycerol synthase n=1 Tax=Rubus argutus TaxID=59490 RepID=A0AAW1VR95_RUBAR